MFLGENGAMLLGLMMSYFMLRILSESHTPLNGLAKGSIEANPVLFMALFSYPLLNLIRVLVLRVVSGDSPLKADLRHIHHSLCDFRFSHLKISLLVMSYTIFVSIIAIILTPMLSINSLFLCLGLFTAMVVYSPFIFYPKKDSSPHDKH